MSPTSSTLPSTSPPPSGQNLLPLFIGITGHRDLREADLQPLREAVRLELRSLRALYPHTPLVALSPLGEGADRLIACVALEEGCDLIVPLPLPRALYEASFENDESRADFGQLLERAQAVFTLPWIERGHDNGDDLQDAPTEAQIEGQYAAMGAYLARYSHVLLALWDGDDLPAHERVGGTAHIVRLRLHGAPPPYGPVISPLERAGYGAVHHVLTPRQSRPLPDCSKDKTLFEMQVLPDANSAEDFCRIDAFNADVGKYGAALGTKAQQNARDLLFAPTDSGAAPDAPATLRLPLSVYGWSDALSTYFSRQVTRTTKRIFGLVFLAALSFNLFHSLPHTSHHDQSASSHAAATSLTSAAHMSGGAQARESGGKSTSLPDGAHSPTHSSATEHETTATITRVDAEHSSSGEGKTGAPLTLAQAEKSSALSMLWGFLPWFLWTYLLLVGVNIALHRRAEKQEWQNKYQDYRALAEGLRVQIFWRMAGLHDDVGDHYLSKQRGELNWIRHAIKSCNVIADAQGETLASKNAALPLVVQQWAREQRNYYVGKTHREHHELERQEKIIRALVIASVGLSVALGLLLSLPSLLPVPILEGFKAGVEAPLTHALIMISIVMLAVTAGLLHGYNAQLARAEHTKRYGRMGTLFQSACVELESQLAAGHTHKMTALLHELGREALAENGDWLMLHRERPLEVPHAG